MMQKYDKLHIKLAQYFKKKKKKIDLLLYIELDFKQHFNISMGIHCRCKKHWWYLPPL